MAVHNPSTIDANNSSNQAAQQQSTASPGHVTTIGQPTAPLGAITTDPFLQHGLSLPQMPCRQASQRRANIPVMQLPSLRTTLDRAVSSVYTAVASMPLNVRASPVFYSAGHMFTVSRHHAQLPFTSTLGHSFAVSRGHASKSGAPTPPSGQGSQHAGIKPADISHLLNTDKAGPVSDSGSSDTGGSINTSHASSSSGSGAGEVFTSSFNSISGTNEDGTERDILTQVENARCSGSVSSVLKVVRLRGEAFDEAALTAAFAGLHSLLGGMHDCDDDSAYGKGRMEQLHTDESFQTLLSMASLAALTCETLNLRAALFMIAGMASLAASRLSPSQMATIVGALGAVRCEDQMVIDELGRAALLLLPRMNSRELVDMAEGLAGAGHSPGILLLDAIAAQLHQLDINTPRAQQQQQQQQQQQRAQGGEGEAGRKSSGGSTGAASKEGADGGGADGERCSEDDVTRVNAALKELGFGKEVKLKH
ncbi:MAG: hypothetical protein WDW38_002592 [Sanguina aurantia]